jgi:hypothetical protein
LDLSVDLAKESVQYSTGDVLVMYGIIVVVVLAIVVVMFRAANKKSK